MVSINSVLGSIKFKLTVIIGITMMCLFAVVIYLIDRGITHHFAEQDEEQLISLANTVAGSQHHMHKKMTANILNQAVNMHQRFFAFTLTLSPNQSLTTSNTPELIPYLQDEFTPDPALLTAKLPELLDQKDTTLLSWQIEGRTYRILYLPIITESAHRAVLVGLDIEFHEIYLAQLHQQLWQMSVIASAFIMLIAYLLIGLVHRPIGKISQTFDHIAVGKLTTRIDAKHYPIELQPMIGAFNRMMQNLSELFEQQANFSADIAHELRTPMTNLITQTQIILGKSREREAYRELLYANLEEFERLSKMINDMLFLANISHFEHANNFPERQPVVLLAELKSVLDYFEAWAEERNIQLFLDEHLNDDATKSTISHTTSHTTQANSSILANSTMLKRAFSNLLSNAIRYAPESTKVNITIEETEHSITVCFSNQLIEPIPDNQIEHLFDRFYRVEPSRTYSPQTSGAGIGLSIVKSILNAHNATIQVINEPEAIHFVLVFGKI